MLRLARPGLGAEYRRANADVRDAARELSPLRDAGAILASFDELIAATHGDRASAGALDGVGAALARRADDAEQADASRALTLAAERLAGARAGVGRWSPDDPATRVGPGAELRAGPARLPRIAGRPIRRGPPRVAQARQVRLAPREPPAARRPERARPPREAAEGPLRRGGDEHDLAVLRGRRPHRRRARRPAGPVPPPRGADLRRAAPGLRRASGGVLVGVARRGARASGRCDRRPGERARRPAARRGRPARRRPRPTSRPALRSPRSAPAHDLEADAAPRAVEREAVGEGADEPQPEAADHL